MKQRIIREVPFLARNVTRMVIDRLSCERDGPHVTIAGEYTRDEVDRLLNLAIPFVPRPPILNRLPPPPPPSQREPEEPSKPSEPSEPEPARAPDAGTDAG